MNSASRFFIIKLALIIYQVNIFFLQLTIGRRVKQLINCTGIIWLLVHSTWQEHNTKHQFWIFRRGCLVRILHGFCTVPDMNKVLIGANILYLRGEYFPMLISFLYRSHFNVTFSSLFLLLNVPSSLILYWLFLN